MEDLIIDYEIAVKIPKMHRGGASHGSITSPQRTEPAHSTSERTSQGSTIPIKKTGPAHSTSESIDRSNRSNTISMGTEPAHDNRQLNIKIAEKINNNYHKYLIPFLIKKKK